MMSSNVSQVKKLIISKENYQDLYNTFNLAYHLPIISNPKYIRSFATSLRSEFGSIPSGFSDQGVIHYCKGRNTNPQNQLTPTQVKTLYNCGSEDLSVAINCGHYTAIDIDIDDKTTARRVFNAVQDYIFKTYKTFAPFRTRENSNRLMLFLTTPYIQSTEVIRSGAGNVEILGKGRSCTVIGVKYSQDSARYHFNNLRILERDPKKFKEPPCITQEDMVNICATIKGKLGLSDSHYEKSTNPASDMDDRKIRYIRALTDLRAEVLNREPNKIHIRCPFEDEHSTGDTSTGACSLLVSEQSAVFKCFHSHCADRKQQDFYKAYNIEFGSLVRMMNMQVQKAQKPTTSEEVVSINQFFDNVDKVSVSGLVYKETKDGAIPLFDNRASMEAILSQTFTIRYEFLSKRIYITNAKNQNLMFDKNTLSGFASWYARHYKVANPNTTTMAQIIEKVAIDNRFSHFREKVEGLKWDGVPRVENFFIKYLDCEGEIEYLQECGKLLFTSLVGRGTQDPWSDAKIHQDSSDGDHAGIRCDQTIILAGHQDVGKSSLVRTLTLRADYFRAIRDCDTPSKLNYADLARNIRGRLVVELAEFGAKSSVDSSLKSFLTESVTAHRQLYNEQDCANLRTCVFIGTTDKDTFLDDVAGTRRFFPVKVLSKNTKLIERDLYQLYAEAYMLFKNNGVMYQKAEKLRDANSQRFRVTYSWEDEVINYINQSKGTQTLASIKRMVDIPDKFKNQANLDQRIADLIDRNTEYKLTEIRRGNGKSFAFAKKKFKGDNTEYLEDWIADG